jgi:hypothetical protein
MAQPTAAEWLTMLHTSNKVADALRESGSKHQSVEQLETAGMDN